MKLPRWLVIAMLTTSVLVPLVAAASWWVTRPERTAQDFGATILASEPAKRSVFPSDC